MWRRSRSRSTFFRKSVRPWTRLAVLVFCPACFITPQYVRLAFAYLSYLSHRPTYVEYLIEITRLSYVTETRSHEVLDRVMRG
jgi:hypothetical protein